MPVLEAISNHAQAEDDHGYFYYFNLHRLGDFFEIPTLCKYSLEQLNGDKGLQIRDSTLNYTKESTLADLREAVMLAFRFFPNETHPMRRALVDKVTGNLESILGLEVMIRWLRKEVPEFAVDILLGLKSTLDWLEPRACCRRAASTRTVMIRECRKCRDLYEEAPENDPF